MAFEIPSYLDPILTFYNIPWPDIDEDAFHNLQQPLRDFGQDLDAVGETIENAIGLLAVANHSTALQSIHDHAKHVKSSFLDPIKGVCGDLAGAPCEIAYDGVLGAKWTLLGVLTGEIANDVVDVVATIATLGLDSALTAAEAVAVREAISRSADLAEQEIAAQLVSAAGNCIDNFVSSLINPFINDIVHAVEGAVDSYLPQFLLRQTSGAASDSILEEERVAGKLHLSRSDLENCVQSIVQSSHHLVAASEKLSTAIEDIFMHAAPGAPRVSGAEIMRNALKGVVHTIRQDLVSGVENLVTNVIDHFTNLLVNFLHAVQQLDEQASAQASKQHAASGAPVAVLSAAGVGSTVAVGVAAATGQIDAERARSVRTEEAAAGKTADSFAVRKETARVSGDGHSHNDDVGEMHRQATGSHIAVGNPTANKEIVDELHPKGTEEGGHVTVGEQTVTGGAVSTEHLGVHHEGEQRPHLESAMTHPQSGTDHLDVKHRDDHDPKMAPAEQVASGVPEEHRNDDSAPPVNVDASSSQGESGN